MKGKIMRSFGALAVMIFFSSVVQSYAGKQEEIVFRHVDNPEIITFSVSFLKGKIDASSEKQLLKNVQKYAFYAEVDINDDGVPERILQYRNRDDGWCGTAGCPSYIFKKSGKLEKNKVNKKISTAIRIIGYERICQPMITGEDPPSWILIQKENGYHLIDTGGKEIIRWKKHKDSRGDLCRVVDLQ